MQLIKVFFFFKKKDSCFHKDLFQIHKKKIELYQCLLDETRDFYLALSSSTHGLFSFSPSRFESNLNCLYKKEKFIRIAKYYFIDRFKRKKN